MLQPPHKSVNWIFHLLETYQENAWLREIFCSFVHQKAIRKLPQCSSQSTAEMVNSCLAFSRQDLDHHCDSLGAGASQGTALAEGRGQRVGTGVAETASQSSLAPLPPAPALLEGRGMQIQTRQQAKHSVSAPKCTEKREVRLERDTRPASALLVLDLEWGARGVSAIFSGTHNRAAADGITEAV